MTLVPLSQALSLLPGRVFLRREAIAEGRSPGEVARLIRKGEWVRLRWGGYCTREVWLAADDRERHLLEAAAAVRALDGPPVLSHASAAAAWGLPLWGQDLTDVHVTRTDGRAARHRAGVVHHAGTLLPPEVTERAGLLVTTPARTLLDVAAHCDVEAGVALADAALHERLTTPDELLHVLDARRDWPGAAHAARVVSLADGRSESVGESRLRVACSQFGWVAEPQHCFDTRQGKAYVDLWIEEWRLALEFDGRVKYRMQEAARQGRSVEDVLWAEKRREDALRALGIIVVRVVWSDLADREGLRRLILSARDAAAGAALGA
jgi:predicted transcriptional regulator of viral defense system